MNLVGSRTNHLGSDAELIEIWCAPEVFNTVEVETNGLIVWGPIDP